MPGLKFPEFLDRFQLQLLGVANTDVLPGAVLSRKRGFRVQGHLSDVLTAAPKRFWRIERNPANIVDGSVERVVNLRGRTGFDELGWRPEGPTFFDYDTHVDDDGNGAYFTAAAYGDVDGDGFVSAFLYAHEDGASPPNVADCNMCGLLISWSGPPTDEGGDDKYRMVTRLPSSAADDF